MVAWWWLIVAFVAGGVAGLALVIVPFWLPESRRIRAHEAQIENANAELEASIARGCRKMPRTRI